MNRDSSPKLLLSREFTSFEELAELAVAWDVDFRQVSKNYSATTAEQIRVGNLLFSNLSCGCFSTHAGQPPEGMFTFTLPSPGCPDFSYLGRLIDRPVLILPPTGQEFHLNARPGYRMLTFSISNAVFDEYCETSLGSSADKIMKSWNRIVSISPEMSANLRDLARQLSNLAQLPPDLSGQFNPVQSFESAVMECLFDGLQQEEKIQKEPAAAERNRALKRALEYIGDHEHAPLNVRDLSATANVSERTLRRLFNSEFGTSPKKFLFGHRMYGAYRQLWQSGPSETRIIDVANAWGFWHMGQFAKDYQHFFDELPSETLNRSRMA